MSPGAFLPSDASDEAISTTCDGLPPGGHLLLDATDVHRSLTARRAGMAPRDTLLCITPGGLRPYVMFRKPLGTTLGKQVLMTSTGGINVDGCRVRHSGQADLDKHKAMVDRIRSKGGSWQGSWKNVSDLSGANEVTTSGRWPPNAVFLHGATCTPRGGVPIPGAVINRFDDGMKPFGNGAGHPYTTARAADETLAVFDCSPGCPVGTLDDQSGNTSTTGFRTPASAGADVVGTRWYVHDHRSTEYPGEAGSASRFFKTFRSWEDIEAYLRRLVDAG